jgi:hypothetical protein
LALVDSGSADLLAVYLAVLLPVDPQAFQSLADFYA